MYRHVGIVIGPNQLDAKDPMTRKNAWRLVVPILAIAAPTMLAAQTPTSYETPPAPVDPARRVTGYPALYGLFGAHEPSPLPLADTATRAKAERDACRAIEYAAKTNSHALLLWHGGKLELAHDFAPYDATSRAWSASMAKTLTALVLGIAIESGAIPSVDTPVATWFPEWRDDAHKAITLRNLLEMTSGLARPATDGAKDTRALLGGNDAITSALALPVATAPGHEFDYYTTNVTLLTEAIHRATGMRFAEYASRHLWVPIGAGDALVAGDGAGHDTPSVFASARDWLRVGVLIKQRGAWDGQQLVPAAFVDAMTAPSPANPNYGWLTWLGSPPGTGRSYGPNVNFKALHSAPFAVDDMIFLDGFGGQRVYISRKADMVLVRLGAMDVNWDDAVLPNAVLAHSKPCAE